MLHSVSFTRVHDSAVTASTPAVQRPSCRNNWLCGMNGQQPFCVVNAAQMFHSFDFLSKKQVFFKVLCTCDIITFSSFGTYHLIVLSSCDTLSRSSPCSICSCLRYKASLLFSDYITIKKVYQLYMFIGCCIKGGSWKWGECVLLKRFNMGGGVGKTRPMTQWRDVNLIWFRDFVVIHLLITVMQATLNFLWFS